MATRKIYFNALTGELIQSSSSPSKIVNTPVAMYVGDNYDLELYPLIPSSADPAVPWTTYIFPVGATYKLGIKKATAFAAPTYYAYTATFSNVTEGSFSGKSCTLDLTGASLIAEITTSEASDEFVVELEETSGTKRTTLTQFTQTIRNQVIDTAAGPDPSVGYLTQEETIALIQGGDSDIQQFHRSSLSSGVESLTVTFTETIDSANWHFDAAFFENTTDSDPDFLMYVLTAKSTTGFTVKFSGPTSSANTVFVWKLNLDPV